MKRRAIVFILLALAACSFHPLPVFAEVMRSFDETATIGVDGRVHIQENIMYDFGDSSRHGIFRTIPYITTNTAGKKFVLGFSQFTVTDDHDVNYTFTTSSNDIATTLKIGDANRTITGMHPYSISYTVDGALTYFSDHDEWYWNVTGNDWDVPINSVSATITLPKIPAESDVKITCFTGIKASTETNCKAGYMDGVVTVATTAPLGISQGLTVVVGFPKNIVAVLEPKPYVAFWDTFEGEVLIILMIIAAILWYGVLPVWIIYRWVKYGRDPKPPMGVTSAWFEAPKTDKGRLLTPGETGSLVDESADMRDITATIVDLARRGYMKIVEKKKGDFYLQKQKEYTGDSRLQSHEKTLLSGLFSPETEVRIKDADLVTTVTSMKTDLYNAAVKEKFFDKNPQNTRTKYYALGGIAFFTGNIFLAIVAFIFGRVMPRKTLSGAQAAAVGQSLKNFLTSQERRLTDQANKQLFFEKLLPYAVAFGVEKIWADRFKNVAMKDPDWYQGYGSHTFSSMYLIHGLSQTHSSVSSVATPTSSSTGHSSGFSGGFSGGGGGGGGGGSW